MEARLQRVPRRSDPLDPGGPLDQTAELRVRGDPVLAENLPSVPAVEKYPEDDRPR